MNASGSLFSQSLILGASPPPDGFIFEQSSISVYQSTFMGIVKGITYTAYVQGEQENGATSAFSAPLSVTAADACSAPLQPTLCAAYSEECPIGLAIEPKPLALTVAWSIPIDTGYGSSTQSNILFYSIEFSQSSAFAALQSVNASSSGTLRATITGLAKGSMYYARIRAYTLVGFGNYSAVSGPQVAVGLPAPPTITSIASGSGSAGYYLTIGWSAPLDTGDLTSSVPISLYTVDLSNSSSFAPAIFSAQVVPTAGQQAAAFNTQSGSSAMIAFLQKGLGAVFYIRVRCSTVMGTGVNSATVNWTVANTPSVPRSVAVIVAGPLALLVTWSPPADLGLGPGVSYPLLQYAVTVQPASLTTTYVLYAAASATQLLVSDFQGSALGRGVGYYVTVQAKNDVGLGPSFLPEQYATAVGLSTAPTGVALCPSYLSTSCGGLPSVAGPLSLRFVKQHWSLWFRACVRTDAIVRSCQDDLECAK